MRPTFASRFVFLWVAISAVLSAGCENLVTFPTPNQSGQVVIVQGSALEPGGRNDYVFVLDIGSTVQVTLAGATAANPLRTVSPKLNVSLGFWIEDVCLELEMAPTVPRFAPILQRQLPNGTFCVGVSDDDGVLTEPVNVVVRVVAPILLETGGSPGTATFASNITPGGRATRTIEASRPGIIQLTLNGLSPANVAGFGLGLPATDGSGCRIARALVTSPGGSPQISEQVEPGTYCVAVIDAGAFAGLQNFSVNISHP